MDHVEGMSAALGFVIINPGCVRENSASLSIKDALIVTIAQATGCLCSVIFQIRHTANHGAESLRLSRAPTNTIIESLGSKIYNPQHILYPCWLVCLSDNL